MKVYGWGAGGAVSMGSFSAVNNYVTFSVVNDSEGTEGTHLQTAKLRLWLG